MKVCSTTVLIAALVLPLTSRAQGKPDFTGTWTMDHTAASPPCRTIRSVRSRSSSRRRRPKSASRRRVPSARTSSPTSWTDRRSKIPGGTRRKSHWDGSTLVVETVRDIQGQTVTTKETRRLSDDGSELLVETMLVVQHGYCCVARPTTERERISSSVVVSLWSLVVGPRGGSIPVWRRRGSAGWRPRLSKR